MLTSIPSCHEDIFVSLSLVPPTIKLILNEEFISTITKCQEVVTEFTSDVTSGHEKTL
jgi:hypothetical protein